MKTQNISLDDIGFIGIGRPMTEEETRLASAHIQEDLAKHPAPKRKGSKRGATDRAMHSAVKATTNKPKGADAKLRSLDDISFIGGGPPMTEKDHRAIAAFIKARKAKHAASVKPRAKRVQMPTKAKGKTKAKLGA